MQGAQECDVWEGGRGGGALRRWFLAKEGPFIRGNNAVQMASYVVWNVCIGV